MNWVVKLLGATTLSFLLSGCFATTEHVKKQDRVIHKMAQTMQYNIRKEQGIVGFHPIDGIVDEAKAIEEEPAGLSLPEGTGGILFSGLETALGGGGVLTAILGMGGMYMRQRKKTMLVAEAAEMEPEAGKAHLKKCGIKV